MCLLALRRWFRLLISFVALWIIESATETRACVNEPVDRVLSLYQLVTAVGDNEVHILLRRVCECDLKVAAISFPRQVEIPVLNIRERLFEHSTHSGARERGNAIDGCVLGKKINDFARSHLHILGLSPKI